MSNQSTFPPVQRLYNEYGSTAGNPHADAIGEIMVEAMKSVMAYIKENNVCPRDTTGLCIADIESCLASYTLTRAVQMKKQRDKEAL